MSAGISSRLPQNVQAHILSFCPLANASSAYPISKKCSALWVQAMMAIVSAVSPQSWVGKQVIRLGFKKWDPTEPLCNQAQRLKIFVRSLASMLSPLQTILPAAERLADFPKTLREQNPQPLIALGNRIARRQEQSLADLVGWLRGHHATSERALKKLEEQDSGEGRQALIEGALATDREEILDAPADVRHFLLELGSFPPEAIQLKIHPTLLTKLVERFGGHVPFVRALMASRKNELVGQEVILTALRLAVLAGDVELVRLFLRDQRLDADAIEDRAFRVACISPNIPNRLQVLRAFRADSRITADMEGAALNMFRLYQNLTQPNWFIVVRFLESRPDISVNAVERALSRTTSYPAQLPIAFRLERLRHLLAHRLVTPEIRGKVLRDVASANLAHDEWLQVVQTIEAGSPIPKKFREEGFSRLCWGIDSSLPIQARLFRIEYLLASPQLAFGSFARALESVAGYTTFSDAEWLQVAELLGSDPRITSKMLKEALYSAWTSSAPVRRRNISHFLNHPRLDEAGRAEALSPFKFQIRQLSRPELEEVLDLYLSHPRTTNRVRQDGLDPFLKSVFNVTKERSVEIFNYILDHPQTSGATLWRFLPGLFTSMREADEHRVMLQTLATHPKAASMPILARGVLAFERFWAFLTSPLPESSDFRFGLSVVLSPLTILRALSHGLLYFISRIA